MEKLVFAVILFCASGTDYHKCSVDAPPSILKKTQAVMVKPAACGSLSQQFAASLFIPENTYPKILCPNKEEK